MAPALMASHGGDVVYDPQQGLVKEWDGTDSPEPVALAFGRAIQLPPGDYVARFTLQAPALAPAPPDGYGTLSVHSKGRAEAIAEAPISPTPDDAFADQLLPFTLTQPTLLEPRILGHAAPLRIQGILLERPGDPVETTPRRTTTLLRPDRIVD
jgi:hypothetical protein